MSGIMVSEVCCICARHTSSIDLSLDFKSEKTEPTNVARVTPCCARPICGSCISRNPRFESYCIYCQISSDPSPLPQGLRDPPGYSKGTVAQHPTSATSSVLPDSHVDSPPRYESIYSSSSAQQIRADREDVIHYLRNVDTLSSLSLAYHVPLDVLRLHNRLHADHLLAARRTISIPASHYQGPSLSDRPVDDPEEIERKAKLRKFMITTKCHEYNVAELYLRSASGDLDQAMIRWTADEKWEQENPLHKGKRRSRPRSKDATSSLVGQL